VRSAQLKNKALFVAAYHELKSGHASVLQPAGDFPVTTGYGGSLRGGYGHGLAADIVSVNGETRGQRFISSESLWKWIDAHGKDFGIGRPYLDKDPAHVAPIEGKEYADHRRMANTQHARSEIRKRDLLAVHDDYGLAKPARTARTARSSP
jgi:hypothetical protein